MQAEEDLMSEGEQAQQPQPAEIADAQMATQGEKSDTETEEKQEAKRQKANPAEDEMVYRVNRTNPNQHRNSYNEAMVLDEEAGADLGSSRHWMMAQQMLHAHQPRVLVTKGEQHTRDRKLGAMLRRVDVIAQLCALQSGYQRVFV